MVNEVDDLNFSLISQEPRLLIKRLNGVEMIKYKMPPRF